MNDVFITGFPGFLGKRLVRELLKDRTYERFFFLVQDKFKNRAKDEFEKISKELKIDKSRGEIITGDITKEDLDISSKKLSELKRREVAIFHFAAVYDLSIAERIAHLINVHGTRNVIEFARSCKRIKNFNHISTCYVSGTRIGRIYEDELDTCQNFKNFYESTKFEAEQLVQEASGDIPTIIFRPSVVIGDSKTGQTDKYDGPYFLIKALIRIKINIPMVNIGRGDASVNLTPVDFTINAMNHIHKNTGAIGRTFQLADPNPLPSKDVVDLICNTLDKKKININVPEYVVDKLFSLPLISKLTGIPRETIVYFNHEAVYDTRNTDNFLAGSGISCPRLSEYINTIVSFVRNNPNLENARAKW